MHVLSLFFSRDPWALSSTHKIYYLTIICCIIGVLKKSFKPAMEDSRDRKAGEYLVNESWYCCNEDQ
uniref:Uncharacterized protein n=1 Tax=Setaria italica TaxID=4555 RepID=K3YBH3_SETIT